MLVDGTAVNQRLWLATGYRLSQKKKKRAAPDSAPDSEGA